MTLMKAKVQARRFSARYNTHWFVVQCTRTEFEPWAHVPFDTTKVPVAAFYLGKEIDINEYFD